MKKVLFLLSIFISSLLHSQSLSPEEKKIVEYIRAHMPQTLETLQQLVDINSGSMNVPGVKKVGEALGKEFEKIGFTKEWISLPDSLKRAGHLVAYKKGNKAKRLLLIGHLDTVFEPDTAPNPYKVLTDSTATGQGVNDMKGGDMIILAALQALNNFGFLKESSITAYFTGDEEKTAQPDSVSRKDFVERAKQNDIALGFESSQGLHTVATARRGASGWQLKVFATQAHSAGIFNGNFGAVYEAARIIDSFRRAMAGEKYLTFNPAFFAGGSEINYDSLHITGSISSKTNIISPLAIVQGDLRFITESQRQNARSRMKSIAMNNNLPGTRAEISFTQGIPAMEPTTGNDKLVQLLNKVTMDMGIGTTKAGDPGSRGAGDISYVAKYLDCLDGLGASGRGAHAPGEIINLKEYPLLIERAAIFIYRLTR